MIIDPEFKAFIAPLADEEFVRLEASILAEGCREALITWRGILIDGHHRYDICTRHGLPYRTTERDDFDSREDVLIWMARNQLGRRNLSTFQRSELALKLADIVRAQAHARRVAGLKQNAEAESTVGVNLNERGRADAVLASLASTSPSTLRKVEDIVGRAPAHVVEQARTGSLSIDRAHQLTAELAGAAPAVIEAVARWCVDDRETVAILKRLHRNGSESFQALAATGLLQPGEESEAVAITDGALKLQRALDLIARTHRQIGADAKLEIEAERGRQITPTDNPHFILGYAQPILNRQTLPRQDAIFTDPPTLDDWYDLANTARRVLKPSGLLIAYCSQAWMPEALQAMASSGLEYKWCIAAQRTPRKDEKRAIWRSWKPILVYGRTIQAEPFLDSVQASSVSAEVRIVLKALVPKGGAILDPYMGTGTIPIAAFIGGYVVTGIEHDQQRYYAAKANFNDETANASNRD